MLRGFDVDGDGQVDARDLRATQDEEPDGRDHDDSQADDLGHGQNNNNQDDNNNYQDDNNYQVDADAVALAVATAAAAAAHDQTKLDKLTTTDAGQEAKLRGRLFGPRDAGLTELGGGALGGALTYVGRNADFGVGNWSWALLPPHLQGLRLLSFATDPTDGGEALYAVFTSCIAVSRDQGDTWGPCWAGRGLAGPFSGLVIKDSHTLLAMRSRSDVPLRTTDGGLSWQPLRSLAAIASWSMSASWSWTGKTLVLQGGLLLTTYLLPTPYTYLLLLV